MSYKAVPCTCHTRLSHAFLICTAPFLLSHNPSVLSSLYIRSTYCLSEFSRHSNLLPLQLPAPPPGCTLINVRPWPPACLPGRAAGIRCTHEQCSRGGRHSQGCEGISVLLGTGVGFIGFKALHPRVHAGHILVSQLICIHASLHMRVIRHVYMHACRPCPR